MERRSAELRGCVVGERRGSESRERVGQPRGGEWMHAWK